MGQSRKLSREFKFQEGIHLATKGLKVNTPHEMIRTHGIDIKVTDKEKSDELRCDM